MKKHLCFILLFFLISCGSDSAVHWKSMQFSKALEIAETQNKLLFVEFFSPT